ncbi:Gfo/Idh/MocA family protein [Companilactobacillus mishanensis]|uniref:Gfo/Idh/MocA family oxidoreductase n=1 Tax=Companilactobacillus mishanensis TaxID=2486008 RepID=A0ABW9P9Y1_9LACO|nr:Gfo/Idh/MocA family oxidoreductase [Companilactobacillus mishanensis]MQS45953.1 Gfo/Idh/MocA family oxidoreductase [Companilactobacillus mishanensis]
MLKLGIIGTNWITQQFVEAAEETKSFKLSRVYSRTEAKAKTFADKFKADDVRLSTDLDEFFASEDFEVVYIASPNSLHFEQAKQAVLNGKNVIVEKPSTSNIHEFAELEEIAKAKSVFVLEAARHIQEPIFKKISDFVDRNRADVSGATLSYMKYSSRYDDYLDSQNPNVFSTDFSGGALYDLGVYAVYDAVVLFGQPDAVNYDAEILSSGVDGSGSLTLKYDDFDVNIIVGKTKNSFMPSEIYFGKRTLLFDSAGDITKIQASDEKKHITDIPADKSDNPMDSEAVEFARIINQNDQTTYKQLMKYARIVNHVLEQARMNAGIVFKADKEK